MVMTHHAPFCSTFTGLLLPINVMTGLIMQECKPYQPEGLTKYRHTERAKAQLLKCHLMALWHMLSSSPGNYMDIYKSYANSILFVTCDSWLKQFKLFMIVIMITNTSNNVQMVPQQQLCQCQLHSKHSAVSMNIEQRSKLQDQQQHLIIHWTATQLNMSW